MDLPQPRWSHDSILSISLAWVKLMLPDMRETTEGSGLRRFTATALQAHWRMSPTLMRWTWEAEQRSFGETVGITFTNKSITSTSPGKTTTPIRKSRLRTAGDMPGQNLTAQDRCGTAVQ